MSIDGVRAQTLSWRDRLVSGGESLLGAVIVIGHNVYRIVPNEVPILVVLAVASMRLREGTWRWAALGFRRPQSWRRILLMAIAAAALRLILGSFIIEPLTSYFWPPIKGLAVMNDMRGHTGGLLCTCRSSGF